jgi:ribosome-associated heat shock protein Hsp15
MTSPEARGMNGQPTLRLDKWLWYARFARTRTTAAKLVTEARFRVNGQATDKPHYGVRPGDVLTFPLGRHVRVIKVLALAERRGPAPEARLLYEDLDPPQPSAVTTAPDAAARPAGAGRPTKRERRAIDRLQGGC